MPYIVKKGKQKEAPAEPGPLRLFTDAWCQQWERKHGEKYLFGKDKDGASAARLVRQFDPAELIELARRAWDRPTLFHCKQAATLYGFAGALNGIRAELRAEGYQRPLAARSAGQGRGNL